MNRQATVTVALVAVIGCVRHGPAVPAAYAPNEALQVIDASPEQGFNFPYILRIPEPERSASPTFLLVEPNNTGTGADDFDVHLEAAKDLSRSAIGSRLFGALHVPLLVPIFPRPRTDWHIYTHALDRDTLTVSEGPLRRLDLQLVAMIEDARARLNAIGLATHEKVLLTGFSASGTFANRFTMLHPNHVHAVATGGVNGLLMLPIAAINSVQLPYPLGLADFEELRGTPFQIEAWRKIPQLIYMGAEDENDAVLFDDGYSQEERALVFSVIGEQMQPDRWERCQALYWRAGATVMFRTYANIGHGTNNEVAGELVQFFRDATAVVE